jgi:hypothetical protein
MRGAATRSQKLRAQMAAQTPEPQPDQYDEPPAPQRPLHARKAPPVGETRRGAFVRLANARVVAAIDQITLIGNLSNSKNYAYKEEDIRQIEQALLEAVKMTMASFRSPRSLAPGFRLGDTE